MRTTNYMPRDADNRTNESQPLFRWAGSKRQLVKVLASYWDDRCERYVEPFAGSACLFFYLRPPKALLSDVNAELIAAYRQVKRAAEDVGNHLAVMNKNKKTYYAIRKTIPSTLSKAAQAARFIYLNRCCFNGLYRTNLAGKFNVPYGGQASGELPSESTLRDFAARLKSASLMAGDFEKALDKVKPHDFVYMDPPFSVNGKRIFKEYTSAIFTFNDVRRLRTQMERLADHRIRFLVSYLESDEGRMLAKGFTTKRVTVRRNISGFINTRALSNEILISYP